MTCQSCGEPVKDHGESRETDFCVGLKAGDIHPIKGKEGRYSQQKDSTHLTGYDKESILVTHNWRFWLPHYSSPQMSAETWGLVEKLPVSFSLHRNLVIGTTDWYVYSGSPRGKKFKGETATLAICQAYLCQGEV